MTREEAIQWLEDIRNLEVNWAHDVAIDMAIEALSEPRHELPQYAEWKEPFGKMMEFEPSGDLISRADAKKEVYVLGKNSSINDIWECLDALPSADRPQGEWVDRLLGEDTSKVLPWERYYCPICNQYTSGDDFNYCPNCGARMRGAE